MDTSNRDTVRASVFEAFLELGAFEENSRVAEWVFDEQPEGEDNRRKRMSWNGRPAPVFSADVPPFLLSIPPKPKSRQHTAPKSPSLSSKLSTTLRSVSLSKEPSSRRFNETTGYETDEGYASSSPAQKKRHVFSLKRKQSSFSQQSTFNDSIPSPSTISSRAKTFLRSKSQRKVQLDRASSLEEGWLEISAPTPSRDATFLPFLSGNIPQQASGKKFLFTSPKKILRTFTTKKHAFAQQDLRTNLTLNLPPSQFMQTRPNNSTPEVFLTPFASPFLANARRMSDSSIIPLGGPISRALTPSVLMSLYSHDPYAIADSGGAVSFNASTRSLPETVSSVFDLDRDENSHARPVFIRGRENPFPLRPLHSRTVPFGSGKVEPAVYIDTIQHTLSVRRDAFRSRYRGDALEMVTCANCGDMVFIDAVEQHVCF